MKKINRNKFLMKSLAFIVLSLVGCDAVEQDVQKSEREKYVEYLREIIADAKKSPDIFIGNTLTDSEEQHKREMVYLDDSYLSYRVEEYRYHGGAHGNTTVSVGTLDRKTGQQLMLKDVFGKDCLPTLEALLRKAVVAKIGDENVQSPVKPTENFYLAADGWHFIYNEYEIACYACGAVEVVVKWGTTKGTER